MNVGSGGGAVPAAAGGAAGGGAATGGAEKVEEKEEEKKEEGMLAPFPVSMGKNVPILTLFFLQRKRSRTRTWVSVYSTKRFGSGFLLQFSSL